MSGTKAEFGGLQIKPNTMDLRENVAGPDKNLLTWGDEDGVDVKGHTTVRVYIHLADADLPGPLAAPIVWWPVEQPEPGARWSRMVDDNGPIEVSTSSDEGGHLFMVAAASRFGVRIDSGSATVRIQPFNNLT